MAHLALSLDALGPVDHQRVAGAAGVLGVALEHREWRGKRRRPAGRVVVVGFRAAQCVEILHVLAQFIRVAVEELVLVHRTVGRTFAGGAIVGAVEDQRVLQLAGLLQVVDDPANLNIGVLGEASEDLGHPGEQLALVGVELSPRPHEVDLVGDVLGKRVQRGEFGALRHHAALDHPSQDPLAVGLVAVVELALVLGDVILGRMVRGVVGAGAEPHVPRLGGRGRVLVAQHPQRLVSQVLRQVVALVGAIRRLDEAVVFDQVGIPVVGLPAQEAVEPVETLGQRPLRAAAAR